MDFIESVMKSQHAELHSFTEGKSRKGLFLLGCGIEGEANVRGVLPGSRMIRFREREAHKLVVCQLFQGEWRCFDRSLDLACLC